MNKNIYLVKGLLVLLGWCLFSASAVMAQHSDLMGNSWNNPTSASIANMLNDRIFERMRAKARARRRSGGAPVANSPAPENRVADFQPPKKSTAQIAAATQFRSTGTQLITRDLANASGNTPEEKEQMFKIMGAALTLYETEARRLGKQNDFALALGVALAVNSSVYNGTPEPAEARLLEIGEAIGELMAENDVFAGTTDRQKQEMYETMVIFTMLVQVGATEAKQKGDAAETETYRQLAAKVLKSLTRIPPEQLRFDQETAATTADNPPAQREESTPAAPAATATEMHAATLVKEFEGNEVRANQLYGGKRVRIHGTVNSIEIDNEGRIVLTFKSSISTYNNARCYFGKSQGSRVAGLSANEVATVEGTVRGLGGGFQDSKAFVILENCIVP